MRIKNEMEFVYERNNANAKFHGEKYKWNTMRTTTPKSKDCGVLQKRNEKLINLKNKYV